MEASALQAPVAISQSKLGVGVPLLRLRSDEQLVALFRAGHDEAFGAIYERYNKRLMAYARQMLPLRQDAEDALQDVFVRAYAGLRASDAELALRAWLFKVAHNRCIDELRRPTAPPAELMQLMRVPMSDPLAQAEQRESLRRLIADVRRLPEQQRSALLMRELGGMSYIDLASALGVTVGAVKSLLVRARLGLAEAAEARDIDCALIREEIIAAHDRGTRPNAMVRNHMRDCVDCRGFRRHVRGVSRQLAAIVPAGPLAALAHLFGVSGSAGSGATAGGATTGAGATGATAGTASAAAGGGAAASCAGCVIGTSHVATLIVAAVATAGGAVELQHAIAPPSPVPHVQAAAAAHQDPAPAAAGGGGAAASLPANSQAVPSLASISPTAEAAVAAAGVAAAAGAVADSVDHFQANRAQPPTPAPAPPPVVATVTTSTAAAPSPAASPPPTSAAASGTSPAAQPAAPTSSSTAPTGTSSSDGTTSSSSGSQASTTTGSSSAPSGSSSSSPASSSSDSAPSASGTSTSNSTPTGSTGSSSSTSGSGSGSSTSGSSSSGA